jgi:acetyl/propionyl-CoA carboxylase alpha subunit
MPNLSPHVQELAGEIVAVRRDLHKYPEVGFQEVRTSGIVARHLKDYGYEVRTGLGQTGVTGLLNVEFLLEPDGRCFLLDANAGLPPAYAVTEMALNLDLLAVDLTIAAGGSSPEHRSDSHRTGHAVQARVFSLAEETCVVADLRWPPATPGRIRIDSDLRVGSELSSASHGYAIATVTAYSPIRHQAILALDRILSEAALAPVPTNVDWLRTILNHRSFMAGQYDTEFAARLASPEVP